MDLSVTTARGMAAYQALNRLVRAPGPVALGAPFAPYEPVAPAALLPAPPSAAPATPSAPPPPSLLPQGAQPPTVASATMAVALYATVQNLVGGSEPAQLFAAGADPEAPDAPADSGERARPRMFARGTFFDYHV